MSIVTWVSKARGMNVILPNLPLCCGLIPTAMEWKRQEMTSIACTNPGCPNHNGVLDYTVDLPKRWVKFVEKVEAERTGITLNHSPFYYV